MTQAVYKRLAEGERKPAGLGTLSADLHIQHKREGLDPALASRVALVLQGHEGAAPREWDMLAPLTAVAEYAIQKAGNLDPESARAFTQNLYCIASLPFLGNNTWTGRCVFPFVYTLREDFTRRHWCCGRLDLTCRDSAHHREVPQTLVVTVPGVASFVPAWKPAGMARCPVMARFYIPALIDEYHSANSTQCGMYVLRLGLEVRPEVIQIVT